MKFISDLGSKSNYHLKENVFLGKSNSKVFTQEGTNVILNSKRSININTLFFSYKVFVMSTHFNKIETVK